MMLVQHSKLYKFKNYFRINNFVKEEKEKDQVKTISNKVPAVKTASIKKRQK